MLISFIWSVACIACVAAVSIDQLASKEVEEVIKSDSFVISLKHIKPRRRLRGSVETLFAVDFPGSQQKFVLMLDRRAKRVAVETVEDGRTRSQHFTVDTLNEGAILNSLILEVNQEQPGAHVTLYLDCVSQGMIATPRSMRDMFSKMSHPRLQVFRERRYVLEVDGNADLSSVLNRNNCPSNLMQAIEPSINEINPIRKADHRSDIPIISNCDEFDTKLIGLLNELILQIKYLREEVERQKAEIHYLRQLLEKCEGLCSGGGGGGMRITCSNKPPPCYPGVQCHDTADGVRCGRCPPDYVGDGKNCKPGITCDRNPCHPGVHCYDTVEGYRCGPCPQGMTGDGATCRPDTPCPYVRQSCPPGSTGNGSRCHDIDECDLAQPCDSRTRCVNLSPGYRCDPCPPGLTGSSGVEGIGLEVAANNRQVCYDINECDDGNNGGCGRYALCINTEGSFICRGCGAGEVLERGRCRVARTPPPPPRDLRLCPDGVRCDEHATCTGERGQYQCVVSRT